MNARSLIAGFAVRATLALVMTMVGTQAMAAASLAPEATRVLHSARSADLYSLEPWIEPDAKAQQLDGYAILGKVSMTKSQTHAAVSEIDKSMAAWEEGPVAACFDPRHALRIRSEGHTYDFLICYACEGIQVYKDGTFVASSDVRGNPGVLNAMLRDGKVPLSTTGDR